MAPNDDRRGLRDAAGGRGAAPRAPGTQESLQINLELASPLDFIPVPEGWEERGTFIEQQHNVAFYHFDLYAQALAKVERGHSQDVSDVSEMLARDLIDRRGALDYFRQIETHLYRFPAIDAAEFRRRVEGTFG